MDKNINFDETLVENNGFHLDILSNIGVENNGSHLGILPHIGEVINNRYEIVRQIARGGMGVIYEAQDQKNNKKVAFKILSLSTTSPIAMKRFEREFKICSHLLHPNIIETYDSGLYNSSPYMVMDYIQGKPIDTYIKEHDPAYGTPNKRNYNLCVKLIAQIAHALEYVHKQKIYHRDVKPSNILVCDDGKPVLIDFGIAKFQHSQSLALTRETEVIGTCIYMPPEQAEGKNIQFDNRSDIYSLGVVLYELVTEKQIFTGSFLQIINKILSSEPIAPTEIRSDIPKALEKIIMHAIEKDRDYRYQTAQEFADALEEYLYHKFSSTSKDYKKQQKREFLEKKIQKTNQKKTTRKKILKNGFTILKNFIFIIAIIILCKNFFTDSNNPTTQSQAHVNIQQEETLQSKQAPKEEEINKEIEQKKENNLYNSVSQKQKKLLKEEEINKEIEQKKENNLHNLSNQQKKEKKNHQNLAKKQDPYKINKKEDAQNLYNEAKKYEEGIGVEKNLSKAIFYYEKAAKQGYIDAQYKLGSIYISKKDLLKAFYWFEKAAKQGHSISQYMVGFFYERGASIEKDLEKARYWYEQAAKQGNMKAREELRRLDNQ